MNQSQHLLIWPRVGDSAFDLNRLIASTNAFGRTPYNPHLVKPAVLGSMVYSGPGLPDHVLRGFESTTNQMIRQATQETGDRSSATEALGYVYSFGVGALVESGRILDLVKGHVERLISIEALQKAGKLTLEQAAAQSERIRGQILRIVESILKVQHQPLPGMLIVSHEGRLILQLSPMFETAATLLGKFQAFVTTKYLPALFRFLRAEPKIGPVVDLTMAAIEYTNAQTPEARRKVIASALAGVGGNAAGARMWLMVRPLVSSAPGLMLLIGAGGLRVLGIWIGTENLSGPLDRGINYTLNLLVPSAEAPANPGQAPRP